MLHNKKTLTIFTPSYNHGKFLSRAYEALKRQSSKDFCWMIIDDGSTDDTKEIVKPFLDETEFEVTYIYKENGGLHTAYNVAIKNLKTELSTCCDADDFMTDDAVEKIVEFWHKHGSNKYAGVYALDIDSDGNCIGMAFSDDRKTINTRELLLEKIVGDKAVVVRSELYKEVAPMSVFDGEKNFNPHYLHHKICEKYNFIILNEGVKVIEYQSDGMSNSMIWQYYNSPRSFMEIRRQYLSFKEAGLKFKAKHSIHYVSSCILAKKAREIFKCPQPFLATVLSPLGLTLSLYIKRKIKKGQKSSKMTKI